MPRILAALCLGLLLSGCIAHAAYDVVTLPVRAGAKVIDWTTTSQSEADRNAGRKARKEQAREDKAARDEEKRDAKAEREGAGQINGSIPPEPPRSL